jgi:hypothetical protein
MQDWAWLAAAFALTAAPALAETLTFTGVMTGADHQTYREIPFHVAAGTTAVTVEFGYTGKDQKSVIDLGVCDPLRLRGWSGGNKAAGPSGPISPASPPSRRSTASTVPGRSPASPCGRRG